MFNPSNIQKVNKLRTPRLSNCFGSTVFSLGLTEAPEWLGLDQIEHFLRTYTRKVKKPQEGDILVLFDHDLDISHTAVKINDKKYWHKPGSMKSESASLNFIIKFYNFNRNNVKKFEHYRFNYEVFDYIQSKSLNEKAQTYIEFLKVSDIYKDFNKSMNKYKN